jgi:hypothetical protein
MAGNPLTDPNWPSTLADQVEKVVGTVREKATAPVIHGARAVVYGLLIFIIAIPVIVLAVLVLTRGLQSFLDLFMARERAVYVSYFLLGGILIAIGALFFSKRHLPDA